MCKRPDNVFFLYRQLRADRHSRHRRSCCRCPAAVIHGYHLPCRNPCFYHNDQFCRHHNFTHSPHRWDDFRRPFTFYHHHQHPTSSSVN
ncbi:hypothetical protein SprV_0200709700 [Sparganum proliferum]